MSTKRCCCGVTTCDICTDDFNRPDVNPPSGNWIVDPAGTGEWEIDGLQLQMITEGPILSTCRPPNPVDASYYSYIIDCQLTGTGNGPWKIICNYTDKDNFDWVLLQYRTVGASSGLLPIFYRRTGGADSALFDPETDYPDHLIFIPRPDDNGGVTPISICYGNEQWALSSLGSDAYHAECGDPSPSSSIPSSLGLVGFLAGATDGSFENFAWTVLWESDHNCPNCSCMCFSSGTDYKCMPETLYLTLTPISSSDPNCSSTGTVMEWTLLQSLPISPPSFPTPVTFDPYPEKKFWFSEPFYQGSADDPCPDWSYASAGETVLCWWRFECIAHGEYELALLTYASGAGTPASAAPRAIAQFTTQDGTEGGSFETGVDCGTGGSGFIEIDFGNFERYRDQLGASGGPWNCCPFPDSKYSVVVDDVP